jgi:F0F1-type ATP synthase membrane subunit b/b'
MSDTKAFNNRLDALNGRLDHVERARLELETQLNTMKQQRDNARADANHWRKEARELHEQIGRIGKGLADLYTLALRESEKNPGEARLASRVQTAQSALDIFAAVTEGLETEKFYG